jgi:hypothetical protein
LARAKTKDPGVHEFYLAGMLRQASKLKDQALPPRLKPLALSQLQRFFMQLAADLAKHVPEK